MGPDDLAGLIFRPLTRTLSPSGPRGRLSIFIFHRILPSPDPLLPDEPDAARFDRLIRFLAHAYRLMTLSEAARRLSEGSLPAGAGCITFDDGYRDNFTQAAPILRRHGVPGSFFIATGFLDGGRMWNDDIIEAIRIAPAGRLDLTEFDLGVHALDDAPSRVAAHEAILPRLKYFPSRQRREICSELARRFRLPERSTLMMTPDQVRSLHVSGMEVGGHTRSHPILARISDDEALAEMVGGREDLEAIIQAPVRTFAYPNGRPNLDYLARHVQLVRRAGFSAALSTEPTIATASSDLLQLPRFTPWGPSIARFAFGCTQALISADGGRGVAEATHQSA